MTKIKCKLLITSNYLKGSFWLGVMALICPKCNYSSKSDEANYRSILGKIPRMGPKFMNLDSHAACAAPSDDENDEGLHPYFQDRSGREN